MAMKMDVVVLCVLTPHSVVEFHAASIFTVKTESLWSFETLTSYNITAHCHNPENHDVITQFMFFL
jgi:hypothetical protein